MAKQKKVLVTGASGFVGANLIRRLIRGPYEVHIIRRPSTNMWRLAGVIGNLQSHTLDLGNFLKLKKVVRQVRPSVIFHLASASVYGGIPPSDETLLKTNFIGTKNLIDACKEVEYECLVNTGSSAEYGPKDIPMKENDACDPVSFYGITKLAGMLYARFIARTKKKPIIGFRLFSPFGPYDEKSRLIPYAVASALRNEELRLANPRACRDYIFVEDVVEAFIKSIPLAKKYPGEIFNIGSGKETKNKVVVDAIRRWTESKSRVCWGRVKPRPFDHAHWQADIRKARKLLFWKPKHTIQDGLLKTTAWYRKNLAYYRYS